MAAAAAAAGSASTAPATARGRNTRVDQSRLARRPTPGSVDRDPLAVTIDSLTPSYIPSKGPILITGSVTNRTEDALTAINLHAFMSGAPMTTSAELAEAVAGGPRRVRRRPDHHYRDLRPPRRARARASAPFSITVPLGDRGHESGVAANTPGVYWFGVHALGDSVEAPRRRPPTAAPAPSSRSSPDPRPTAWTPRW